MASYLKVILYGVLTATLILFLLSMIAIWVMFMGGVDLTNASPALVIPLVLLVGTYLFFKGKSLEYLYVISGFIIGVAAFFLPVFIFLTIVPALVYGGYATAKLAGSGALSLCWVIAGCVGVISTSLVILMFGETISKIDGSKSFIVELVVVGVFASVFGSYIGEKENIK